MNRSTQNSAEAIYVYMITCTKPADLVSKHYIRLLDVSNKVTSIGSGVWYIAAHRDGKALYRTLTSEYTIPHAAALMYERVNARGPIDPNNCLAEVMFFCASS